VNKTCVFCEKVKASDVLYENELAAAFRDGFPISKGHTLIITKDHIQDYFELNKETKEAMNELVEIARNDLIEELNPDAFNFGLNSGQAAGQTVGHAHLHLIPRFEGDVEDPRGGIRWIISEKAKYW
jgi:diadenosine tetraphosphate (Ap4A) HIT family hydrolase